MFKGSVLIYLVVNQETTTPILVARQVMYQVFRKAISLTMMVWYMTPNIKSLSHNFQSGPYDGVEMGGATCKNVNAAASTIHAGCGVLFLLATAFSLLHGSLQVL